MTCSPRRAANSCICSIPRLSHPDPSLAALSALQPGPTKSHASSWSRRHLYRHKAHASSSGREKNDVPITMKNIAEDLRFGSFRVPGEESTGGVLTGLNRFLRTIYNPTLKALRNWGQIEKDSHHVSEFLVNMTGMASFLEAVQTNLEQRVVLKHNDELSKHLATPREVIAAAGNPELIEQAEELVLSWCKQMETVLVQSEQMRKEGDDTGPLAELEHWRHLTTKFNDMVEQIRSEPVQMVLQVLIQSKSKVFKAWRDIDMRVTDAANESRDNLKFLYSLEKFCRPLYASHPVAMREALPSLIGAIRLINTISRYGNGGSTANGREYWQSGNGPF